MKRERVEGLLGSELLPDELARLQAWFGARPELTQQDLAHAVDTDSSVISKALSGDIPMSLARLRVVCRLLGHEIHELFAPGPTVIETQPDLTPVQIAMEMERLSRMLRRVTRQEAKRPALTKSEFLAEADEGQRLYGAVDTKSPEASPAAPAHTPESRRAFGSRSGQPTGSPAR